MKRKRVVSTIISDYITAENIWVSVQLSSLELSQKKRRTTQKSPHIWFLPVSVSNTCHLSPCYQSFLISISFFPALYSEASKDAHETFNMQSLKSNGFKAAQQEFPSPALQTATITSQERMLKYGLRKWEWSMEIQISSFTQRLPSLKANGQEACGKCQHWFVLRKEMSGSRAVSEIEISKWVCLVGKDCTHHSHSTVQFQSGSMGKDTFLLLLTDWFLYKIKDVYQ